MKKFSLLAFFAMASLFMGCELNAPATSNKVTTGSATDITDSSVILHGKVNVDIANYKDVAFGMMVAETKAELNERAGETYRADILIAKDYELELHNLLPNKEYYYCAWLCLNNTQYEFGGIKSFTTADEAIEYSHEYVDLGLSVKWATCNIGALSPEEYGDYFAWGEVTTKKNYNWTTYKLCNGTSSTIKKYCTSNKYGTVDNKITLAAEDDAATVHWKDSWRMPTEEEWYELCRDCTWKWTSKRSVKGYVITSKTNGNSIFLPAAGLCDYDNYLYTNERGYYWSSSLVESTPSLSFALKFDSYEYSKEKLGRAYGKAIRPVHP